MMQSKLFVRKVFNESLVQAERCKFARKQITGFFYNYIFQKRNKTVSFLYSPKYIIIPDNLE